MSFPSAPLQLRTQAAQRLLKHLRPGIAAGAMLGQNADAAAEAQNQLVVPIGLLLAAIPDNRGWPGHARVAHPSAPDPARHLKLLYRAFHGRCHGDRGAGGARTGAAALERAGARLERLDRMTGAAQELGPSLRRGTVVTVASPGGYSGKPPPVMGCASPRS